MPSPKRIAVVILLIGIIAGCSGIPTQEPPQTAVPTDEVTTESKTTLESKNGTSDASSCSVDQLNYEFSYPKKPIEFNKTTIKQITVEYEKRYQRVRYETIYNLTRYQSSLARSELEKTDDGFEVTVKIRVEFRTSEGTQGSGGYPHTYLVSNDEVVRDGETVICW